MTNKMDPFNQTKKKKAQNYKNFIEAFKDIGSSTIRSFTKDVVGGTVKSAVDALTKTQSPADSQTPKEDFNFQEYLNLQERKIRQQERTRFESIKREEKVIFSREQQQIKIEIQTLQTQIKKLAGEQIGLMKEVEQASFQAVINPGVYHQNFFERLIHLIKLAKKRISESRTWLHLYNRRAKQQKGYWAGVKKSGTSFMLSGERTVSTQSG